MRERRLRKRSPIAPRRVRRPAQQPHVDRPHRDAAAPDEILDVVTGPFERAIGRPGS